MYEDTPLKEGNDLIQLAVTQMDDGTYTFNPVGQNFNDYCKLANYYCDNKSLACVRQKAPNKAKQGELLTYPSLVDLLGIALVLANKFQTIHVASADDIRKEFMLALMKLNKFPEPTTTELFESTPAGCIASFTIPPPDFFKISGLTEFEVQKILTFIKHMMFFSKYALMPDNFTNMLTFKKIFDPKESISHIVDRKLFQTKTTDDKDFPLYKVKFFEPEYLKALQVQASAAPVPAPASAAPAPPPPSSDIASLESRVAKLESEVAALKDK
jgi:hypothetical protein